MDRLNDGILGREMIIKAKRDFTNKYYVIYWISIQALLSAPNPDDPLSENIAKHWKTNETEAVETGNIIICSCCWLLPKMLA